MLRHLLAVVAVVSLLLPPTPAVGQFRELIELFQPKPKPKPRHRLRRPAPLPPTRPAQDSAGPAKPPAAADDEAAIAVPVPSISPRPQGGGPASPPAGAGRDATEAATGQSGDVVEDRWSETEIMDALRACVERLGSVVAEIEVLAPIKAGRCGSAAPLRLTRLGAHPSVEISPAATLNCDMVLRLGQWIETVVQPAARRVLGSPVVRFRNASSYSCRNRNGAKEAPLSEHAVANALDISGFVTENGRVINPRKDWGLTEREIEAARRASATAREATAAGKEKIPRAAGNTGNDGKNLPPLPPLALSPAPLPPLRKEAVAMTAAHGRVTPPPRPDPGTTPERAFLRRVHKDACGLFGTVLGPEANDAHKDHFHLDLATRRHGAFCE